MKKVIIYISAIILSIYLIKFCADEIIGDYRIEMFVNDGIVLPKADSVDTIFRFKFRCGEDLEILNYNQKNAKKISDKKSFQQIDEKNISFVKERIEYFYSVLSENDKKLFDENVDMDTIISLENYYTYKVKNKNTFLLLILDSNSNKLFCLNRV